MKILHTSDWHLGQQFFNHDRTYEHRCFLEWLLNTVREEQIDVLLISGDVFDVSNPSALSIRMFYRFLIEVVKSNPQLQIVVTAGNHDSASRLETPQPLVELMNIHIVGNVKRDGNGNIDFDSITIPLKDKNSVTRAWCIAAPFLRLGDYPAIADSENPYAAGVASFYQQALAFALQKREADQAIIAMGHLHTVRAYTDDQDLVERQIMGGIEGITPDTFGEEICYVALGHIHKAQSVGGKEHIRYCGSPIPMSFSEINYNHQVTIFDIEGTRMKNLRFAEIPVTVPLKRIEGALSEVLDEIALLPETPTKSDTSPLLEVRVFLEGPEPSLRHTIDEALEGKDVRLAKIVAESKRKPASSVEERMLNPDHLKEIKPAHLLQNIFQSKFGQPLPDHLLRLFHQAEQEVEQGED